MQVVRRCAAFSALVALLFSALVVATPSSAQAQTAAEVSIGGPYVTGLTDSFDVTGSLLPGATPVAAVSFEIAYDPALVSPVIIDDPGQGTVGDPVCSSLAPVATVFCGPSNPNGVVQVAVFRISGAWTNASAADLALVPFVALGTAGQTDLDVTVTRVTDVDGQPVPEGGVGVDTTVTIQAPLDAVNDSGSGVVGVSDTYDVASNDVDVPAGADFSLSGGGNAAATPSIDADSGEITYTPILGEADSNVTIEYEVCPDGVAPGSTGCDTATLTISVDDVPNAVNDSGSGIVGVSDTYDVASNDFDVPAGADFSLTGGGNAVNVPSIDSDSGEVTYTPVLAEAGSNVTIEYEVCPDGVAPGSTACDTATLTISVEDVPNAVNDSGSGIVGVSDSYDVASNDVDVPAGADFSLTGGGNAAGTPSIDADSGEITYTPTLAEAGSNVTIEYEVCPDGVAPGSLRCDTATLTISVEDVPNAVNDTGSGVVGVGDSYDVASNDVDVPAGADFSLTGGGNAAATPSIDPDSGEIAYTPVLAEAGSNVTVEYEVCPDGVAPGSTGCDTATLTISVDDVPNAVNDSGSGVVGVSDSYDVASNDIDVPAGADFSLTGGGNAAATPSIDPDSGEITYTPVLAEAGSNVTVEYEVCPDGVAPGSLRCDTATLTISVDAVPNAVNDSGSGVVGVSDSYDVASNDVDVPAGADFSLTGGGNAVATPSIDPDSGEITYTPVLAEAGSNVTVEYEVCPDGVAPGSTACDTATLTISVDAVPNAVNDTGSGVVNTSDSYDVAANDIDVPAGADFSLTGGGNAVNVPSIDPDSGEITYTPALAEAGNNVAIEYEVCPDGVAPGSTACDTATLTIAVAAVAGAVNDSGSGIVGVSDSYDVAANDIDVPTGADFSLTGGGNAANVPSIDPDSGEITYTPALSEAGTNVTIEYEVCPDGVAPGSASCDTATLTISVEPLIDAADDTGAGVVGVTDTYGVAANDVDVPAGADFSLTGGGNAVNVPSIDADSGEITYTPALSEAGGDAAIEYEVCPDGVAPGSVRCDTATLTISVDPVVDAIDDTATGAVNVVDTYDVASNDIDVPAGADFSLTGAGNAVNVPTIDSDTGEITYAPALLEADSDVAIEYEVCPDGVAPGSTTCDIATLTVSVAELPIDAVNDSGAGVVGVSDSYDVASNDVDVPAGADFSLTGGGNAVATPSIDPDSGVVAYTPALSEADSDVAIEYEVCPDGVTPGSTECDTATLTISVDPVVDAVDDTDNGVVNVLDISDVASNDVDVPVGADFSLTGGGNAVATPSIDADTGDITYTPDSSEANTDVLIEYEVCPDGVAPGSLSCDTATLTISVAVVVPPIDAVDDSGSGVVGVSDSYDVASNDVDVPVGADFSLTGGGNAVATPAIDADTGEITYTPDVSESDSDVAIEYEVCPDGVAPGSTECDTATLTISVDPVVDAVDDTGAGAVGVSDSYDVVSNDVDVPAGADFSLTGGGNAVATPAIDADTGEITYTPDATESGDDVTIEYEVCPDGVAPGAPSCDTATLTISVAVVVPPIDAVDDTGAGAVGVSDSYDVAGNDVDVPVGADFSLTGGGNAVATPAIDADTGEITYTPDASESGDDVAIEYEVCPDGVAPGSLSCDTATLTISVAVVVPPIDAVDDSGSGVVGVSDSYDVASNDVDVPVGADFSLTGGGNAVATPAIDADTGEITYTPDVSESDSDVAIEYEVCPDGVAPGSTECDTATLTISVDPVVDAVDDTGAGAVGVSDSYDVASNDVDVPAGADFSLTGGGNAVATPAIDADTGEITYTPDATESGDDVTIEYEVCPDGVAPGAPSCDTATLTISVAVIVPPIDAVDDTGAGVVGFANTYDVAGNDIAVPAGADFFLTGTGSAVNTQSIDADTGEITYTPDVTEADATATIEYEVCPDGVAPGSAECDTALLTITVDSLTAVNETSTGEVGVSADYDVAANDLDVPPGSTYELTGNGSASGAVSIVAATGQITYTPAAGEGDSIVTIEYEVCPPGASFGVSSPACGIATLSIAVDTEVPPISLVNDTGVGEQGVAADYNVTANDANIPVDAEFYLPGTGSGIGATVIDPDSGVVTYTPDLSEAGSDVTVAYEACPATIASGDPSCDDAVLTITVADLPPAIDAVDDSGTGIIDVANSYDVAGNDLNVPVGAVFSITGGNATGLGSINPATGEITYAPPVAEVASTVTVEYEVCPSGVAPGDPFCDTALLRIAVAPAIEANDDTGTGEVGSLTEVQTASNDSAIPVGAGYAIIANDGAATPTISGTGMLSYTPAPADDGQTVTITYEICPPGVASGAASCDTADVVVTVDATPPPIQLIDDTGTGELDVLATYDVASNDLNLPVDADFTIAGTDGQGDLDIDPSTGIVSYTPRSGDEGTDVTVTYSACPDGVAPDEAPCDTADLVISVEPVVAPSIVAVDDTGAGTVGVAGVYPVADNDLDVPAGADFSLVNATSGTPTIDPDTGDITFTPAPIDVGTDVTITYEICPDGVVSGDATCDTATLTITVPAIVAVADAGTGEVDTVANYDVAANDNDVPAGSDFRIVASTTAGPADIDPDTGVISYSPGAADAGQDVTVTYEVCPDGIAAGSASCDSAILTIAVALVAGCTDCFDIGVSVWFDSDISSSIGSSDVLLSGLEVGLFTAGADDTFGTSDDVLVATATTAAVAGLLEAGTTGVADATAEVAARFFDVVPGDYEVRLLTTPEGQTGTVDPDGAFDGRHQFSVVDADIDDIRFGFSPASIAGFVRLNGAGVAGVTVTTTDSDGNVFNSVTDATGRYEVVGSIADPLFTGNASVSAIVGGATVSTDVVIVGATTTSADLTRTVTTTPVAPAPRLQSPQLESPVITNPPPSAVTTPVVPAAPIEPPLAHTGTEALRLVSLAMMVLAVGGFMAVASRRLRRED